MKAAGPHCIAYLHAYARCFRGEYLLQWPQQRSLSYSPSTNSPATLWTCLKKNKISAGQLVELDNEDMKELGVVALGDRKRLLKAIEEARTLGAEQEELASWPQDLPVNTRLS